MSSAIATLRIAALHRAAAQLGCRADTLQCREALAKSDFAGALARLEPFGRYPRWLARFLKRWLD